VLVAQLVQVVVAACSWSLSDDISELLSDCAVTTLIATLARANRTTSPMMSLPLMVRKDSTLASRASATRRGRWAPGAGISSLASARNRRRGQYE
jgi:hypothetical protein